MSMGVWQLCGEMKNVRLHLIFSAKACVCLEKLHYHHHMWSIWKADIVLANSVP